MKISLAFSQESHQQVQSLASDKCRKILSKEERTVPCFCGPGESFWQSSKTSNQMGTKGCSRNYPQGGLATFFFRPLHPQDKHGMRAPWPPGHVSALINPPHYGSNMPWPAGQVTSHPSDKVSTKHPPPTGQKSVCSPPPPPPPG